MSQIAFDEVEDPLLAPTQAHDDMLPSRRQRRFSPEVFPEGPDPEGTQIPEAQAEAASTFSRLP